MAVNPRSSLEKPCAGEDLNFISIHTPPNAARADEAYGRYGSVEAYFDEKGYSYPTVIDTNASIRDALKIAWTPSYLLVAPDLTVPPLLEGRDPAPGCRVRVRVEGSSVSHVLYLPEDWRPGFKKVSEKRPRQRRK